MDYKKIIKSRETRFKILKALSFVPDSLMLPLQYRIYNGNKLHLKNPKRFTEKLQLYKMYYRNPVLPICVDKYRVREFIEQLGMPELLNDLYGVYAKAEDIEFDKLPNEFIIKTTDGGGGNNIKICKDKSRLDIPAVINEVNSWLDVKAVNAGREWAYTGITKSQIIVERLMHDPNSHDGGLTDYKIFCFQGKPEAIIVDWDRYIDHKRNFFDTKWNAMDIQATDSVTSEEQFPKPSNLDELLSVASKLSAQFPFVRVDLYNIEGKIYFGELTFYPWSGYVNFTPDQFDFDLGEKLDLSTFLNR